MGNLGHVYQPLPVVNCRRCADFFPRDRELDGEFRSRMVPALPVMAVDRGSCLLEPAQEISR